MLGFFSLTLFVSAALLFFVQPMIGKMLLPRLGGTPAVWNTCMVFFQAMLLVGYGYTHAVSTTQNRRRQLVIQGVILFLPLVVLPFALGTARRRPRRTRSFGCCGCCWAWSACRSLSSRPPRRCCTRWFATTGHPAGKDPYFLYGASNLGSMLGLLAYPALIEWMWDVPTQAVVWTVGYSLFIALVLGCAYIVWRSPEPAVVVVDVPAEPLAALQPALQPKAEPVAVATAVTTAGAAVSGTGPPPPPSPPRETRSSAPSRLPHQRRSWAG